MFDLCNNYHVQAIINHLLWSMFFGACFLSLPILQGETFCDSHCNINVISASQQVYIYNYTSYITCKTSHDQPHSSISLMSSYRQ